MKAVVPFLVLGILASCASLPLGGGKEPRTIVIRNRSGEDIETVLLREPGTRSQGVRFGSISPVPKGLSQEIGRSSDPPPLPRTITIEWVDHEGRTQARDLSLSKVLRSATGDRNEALVFEFGPVGDVQVFLENR